MTPEVPATAGAPPIVYEYDEAKLAAMAGDAVPNQADITDVPIHVWVGVDDEKAIQSIRVTGHATEEVCAEASLALLAFLGESTDVEGYLGFGVADIHAARGARDFQRKAHGLVRELSMLAAKHPEFVIVTEHRASPAWASSAPPDAAPGTRIAVRRYRDPRDGPAFIPARTWSPGESPAPIQLDVRTADLGVDASLLSRLAPDLGVAPLVELVEVQRYRQRRLDRLAEWRAAGQQLDDGVMSFWMRPQGRSPSPEELLKATETLERYAAKRYAISLVLEGLDGSTIDARTRLKMEQDVRDVDAAVAVNARCQRLLAKHSTCGQFVDIEPDTAVAPEEAALARMLLSVFDRMPLEQLRALQQRGRDEGVSLQRKLDWWRKQPAAQRLASARERTIDGLLRGWPIPVGEDDLADSVDAVEANQIARAWPRLLASVRATRKADLTDPGHVAGALQRANVFYRATEISSGRYRVEPFYVVVGPFLEVWDTDKHVVTIEAPGTYARPAATAENKAEESHDQ